MALSGLELTASNLEETLPLIYFPSPFCRNCFMNKGTSEWVKMESWEGKRRETLREAGALFIFTGTFQELTAIPLSELNFSAIFQTPDTVCEFPLTPVWHNEE